MLISDAAADTDTDTDTDTDADTGARTNIDTYTRYKIQDIRYQILDTRY